MTYILILYTVVALGNNPAQANDRRPMGEFHPGGDKSARTLCEEAAQQLGVKSDRYRCVRSK